MNKVGMIYKADAETKRNFKVIVGFNAMTDEFIENYRKLLHDFRTVEDHVRHIAENVARFGDARYLIGYKNIIHNGYDNDGNNIPEEELCNYINIVWDKTYSEIDVDIY